MIPETTDTFVRQRRNLLIATISLFLLTFTDAKLEQINLVGNKFEIGSPEKLMIFIWIVFFYLLWRYYTVLKETDTGFATKFHVWKIKYIEEEAEVRLASKEYIDDLFKKYTQKQYSSEIEKVEFDKVFDVHLLNFKDGLHEVSGKLKGYIYFQGQQNKQSIHGEYRVKIPDGFFLTKHCVNFLYVIFFTNRFSEFYMPLMLAILLTLYEAWSIFL